MKDVFIFSVNRFPAVVKPKVPRKPKALLQKSRKGVRKAPVERFPGVNPAFAHLSLVDRRKYVPPSFGIRRFAKIVEVVIPLRRKPHVILTNPAPDVNWEDEDGEDAELEEVAVMVNRGQAVPREDDEDVVSPVNIAFIGTVLSSLRFPETNASLEQSADEDEEEMPDVVNDPNIGDESDGMYLLDV
jgi:hypothetical protein